jgi:hypothetical protein
MCLFELYYNKHLYWPDVNEEKWLMTFNYQYPWNAKKKGRKERKLAVNPCIFNHFFKHILNKVAP